MSFRLPPLKPLRYFEATARHLSFSRAGDELCVTTAAVSLQVKLLEGFLGKKLFLRNYRPIQLTEAGQVYYSSVSEGFCKIAEMMECPTSTPCSEMLTIGVAPAFAAKWLIPRLKRFTENYPELDVRLMANRELVNFQDGQCQIAIHFGQGRYPDLKCEKLLGESVTPMCSQKLLMDGESIRTPADLKNHTLLHDDSNYYVTKQPTWKSWLQAAGAGHIDSTRGPRFSHPELLLAAARENHGVALGRTTIGALDIAAGKLACPFELTLPLNRNYYIVGPEESFSIPKVSAFIEWLWTEARHEKMAAESSTVAAYL